MNFAKDPSLNFKWGLNEIKPVFEFVIINDPNPGRITDELTFRISIKYLIIGQA